MATADGRLDPAVARLLARLGKDPAWGSHVQALPDYLMSDIVAIDPDAPAPVRFPIHVADEALEPVELPEEIVAGLTTRGSLAAICGDAGTGKTFLELAKGVCVSAGLPYLGRATTQGSVLIIDEESGHRRLHARLNGLMRGYEVLQPGLPISWITSTGFNLLNPLDIVKMKQVIAELAPSLVIIDALMEVTGGADENSTQDMAPVLHTLHGWAQQFQCAIDLIHHANRQGKYRGASAIKGIVDQMLVVTKEEDDTLVRVRSEKNRDGEPIRFDAILEVVTYPSSRVVLREVQVPKAQRKALKPSEIWVLDFGQQHGRFTIDGIMAEAESTKRFSSGTAKNATWTLVDKKLLSRVDGGGKGSPATFQLSTSGDLQPVMSGGHYMAPMTPMTGSQGVMPVKSDRFVTGSDRLEGDDGC